MLNTSWPLLKDHKMMNSMACLEKKLTIKLITFKYIVHVRLDTDEYLLVRLRVGFSNANREKRGSRNFLRLRLRLRLRLTPFIYIYRSDLSPVSISL